MAKSWSGFLPQNISAKEEWALLEASAARGQKERQDDLVYWNTEALDEPVKTIRSLVELIQKVGNQS